MTEKIVVPSGYMLFDMGDYGVAPVPKDWTPDQLREFYRKSKAEIDAEVAIRTGKAAPTEVGTWEAFGAGAEKSVGDLWRGVQQAFTEDSMEGAIARADAEADAQALPAQEQHPVAFTLGESAPYAATLPMGPVGAALSVGAGEALKYGEPGEKLTRGISGAATSYLGEGAGRLAGALVAPVAKSLVNDTYRQALKAAKKLGVKLRLSQVTGGKFSESVEGFAAFVPGGAGSMQELAEENSRAITKAAARSIGLTVDNIGPEALQTARRKIVEPFREIDAIGGHPIKLGEKLKNAAVQVLKEQSQLDAGFRSEKIVAQAQRALELADSGARITGKSYQLNRSALTDASHTAYQAGEGVQGKAYETLLRGLDDSADDSLRNSGRGKLVWQLRKSREQYSNLMLLEKGRVLEGGKVNPNTLATAVRAQNPTSFREGRQLEENPLHQITLIAENLKPVAGLPQQAYARSAVQGPISAAVHAPIAATASAIARNRALQALPRTLLEYPALHGVLNPMSAALPYVGRLGGRGALQNMLLPNDPAFQEGVQ